MDIMNRLQGALVEGNAHEVIEDGIRLAAHLFERHSGWEDDSMDEEVRHFCPSKSDIETTKDALQRLLNADIETSTKGTVVWALSKLGDKDLIPTFQECLKAGVSRGDDLLHQSLIALNELGELRSRNGSFSIFDREENLRIAKCYLDSK